VNEARLPSRIVSACAAAAIDNVGPWGPRVQRIAPNKRDSPKLTRRAEQPPSLHGVEAAALEHGPQLGSEHCSGAALRLSAVAVGWAGQSSGAVAQSSGSSAWHRPVAAVIRPLPHAAGMRLARSTWRSWERLANGG
jgi:hypothetical protein